MTGIEKLKLMDFVAQSGEKSSKEIVNSFRNRCYAHSRYRYKWLKHQSKGDRICYFWDRPEAKTKIKIPSISAMFEVTEAVVWQQPTPTPFLPHF
jgi:hypothetical protein